MGAVKARPDGGMRTFFIVWFGQLISVVGSGLTRFGIGIWVFLETGSVTSLALVIVAGAVPAIVVGPFAGTIVDRTDRRVVMLVSDLVAGAASLALAMLWISGSLELWHIVVVAAIGSTADGFQQPAYLASVTLLVPKKHLNRANGLTNANEALSVVLTPVLAGLLVASIGIGGILIIDFATFLFAVGTLLVVRIPRPEPSEAGSQEESLWEGTADGLRYLGARTGLLLFLILAAVLNFLLGFTNVLFFPLFLSFTSEAVLGTAMSVLGLGMLAGSMAASAWGGPKQRMRFILFAIAVGGVFIAMVGVRASAVWIAAWAFGLMALIPVINATSQALWQTKVAPDYQGRVFATRRVIASIAAPVAYLLAGPLADGIFEPLLADRGRLASSVGEIVGTGPGRGIGLMFVVMGLSASVVSLLGFAIRPLRNVESDLPDAIPETPPTVEAAIEPTGDIAVEPA